MIRVRSLDAAFGSGAGPKKDMLSHLHSLCPVFGPHFKFIFTDIYFPLIFRPIGPGACIPIIPPALLSVSILMGLLATWDTILNSHLEEAKHNCHGWLPLFSPPAWSHFSFFFPKMSSQPHLGWEPSYIHLFSSQLWVETWVFISILIKSSSGDSLQVCTTIYSLCCWEPVEVPSEWPHQPFLLGDGGTMAIGLQLKAGHPTSPPAPAQLFGNVAETDGTCHLFCFLLVFRCLLQHWCPQSPGGNRDGLSQRAPYLGTEEGEERGPASRKPCLHSNEYFLAISIVISITLSNGALALHQALKCD